MIFANEFRMEVQGFFGNPGENLAPISLQSVRKTNYIKHYALFMSCAVNTKLPLLSQFFQTYHIITRPSEPWIDHI